MKSIEAMCVPWSPVRKRTGKVIRSENSLNQHIKNKHPELWETIKHKAEQVIGTSERGDADRDMMNMDMGLQQEEEVLNDDDHIRI